MKKNLMGVIYIPLCDKKNTSGQVVSYLKLLWLFLKLFWFLFKVDWIFLFACMCSNGPTILWRIERNYCFQSLSWMGVSWHRFGWKGLSLCWFVNQIWKCIQATLGYMRAVYSSTVYYDVSICSSLFLFLEF